MENFRYIENLKDISDFNPSECFKKNVWEIYSPEKTYEYGEFLYENQYHINVLYKVNENGYFVVREEWWEPFGYSLCSAVLVDDESVEFIFQRFAYWERFDPKKKYETFFESGIEYHWMPWLLDGKRFMVAKTILNDELRQKLSPFCDCLYCIWEKWLGFLTKYFFTREIEGCLKSNEYKERHVYYARKKWMSSQAQKCSV